MTAIEINFVALKILRSMNVVGEHLLRLQLMSYEFSQLMQDPAKQFF